MKKTLLLLLAFLPLMMLAEIKLTVVDLNGKEKQFALSSIGKITFNNGVMYLYDQENTLLGFNDVEQVGQVVVEHDGATSIDAVENQLRVFADPALQQLVVEGLPVGQTLRVYDTAGRLLSSTPSQPEQTRVDVSALQGGTYLLQFGAQVVKFVKQ